MQSDLKTKDRDMEMNFMKHFIDDFMKQIFVVKQTDGMQKKRIVNRCLSFEEDLSLLT